MCREQMLRLAGTPRRESAHHTQEPTSGGLRARTVGQRAKMVRRMVGAPLKQIICQILARAECYANAYRRAMSADGASMRTQGCTV